MKARNVIGRFLRASVITAVAFAYSYQPAIAAEAAKDVSKEISELRSTTVSVEVYIVPGNFVFREPLTERDVLKIACRRNVVTTDQVVISSLVDILEHAKLAQIFTLADEYAPRIVIRLQQGNSRLHTLVLSRDYTNANAHGEYRNEGVSAPGQTISVEATNNIEKALRAWAEQQHSPTHT